MTQTLTTILTAATASLLTLVIQKGIGNALSGVKLWFTRPFKRGDKVSVKFNSYEVASGHVMSLGLNHTKLKAYNRDVYIIPNSQFDTYTVVNSDYKAGMNYTDKVFVTLDSDIDIAINTIAFLVINHPETLNDRTNTNVIVKYDNPGYAIIQYNVRTLDVNESFRICSEVTQLLIKNFNVMESITLV